MDILQRYYSGFDDTKLTTEEVAIVDDMVSEIERLKEENELYKTAIKKISGREWQNHHEGITRGLVLSENCMTLELLKKEVEELKRRRKR